ncbi:MAG: glycosyltransferase family 4 protein [Solidesulfovibrio sp. DCME]|uniref:glycosyltransferase family 4 protein n=1 Tax=Solidesulfovibrio sp. DCME TaxID=3447380 RepID=UPI003D0C7DC1
MKVALYAPFKPLDHPAPSGDRTIGRELAAALAEQGLEVVVPTRFRSRWLSARPLSWLAALAARREALGAARREGVAAFLTYHTYYKSPDVVGPYVARTLGIPYVIFQGIYSTKPRRRLATRLGFELNRRALLAARAVFTNRRLDAANLGRLLPCERIIPVRPGIDPALFAFDAAARRELRQAWGVGEAPVVVTAAMFRDDVKSESLAYLFRCLGALAREGLAFFLAVAGDGPMREPLAALAARELPGRHLFLGLVAREALGAVYGAGDLFAFPGIRESLGMVYLEAQAAGLPVVALADGGVPEVVEPGITGLLTPPGDAGAYRQALRALLVDKARRRDMGEAASLYVRAEHDSGRNYGAVAAVLRRLAGRA